MNRFATNEQGYSGSQAAAIVGITYRQLDYWARTDLVRPAINEAQGSGSRRHYSYRNLLELRMVKSLLDAGIKLEAIREVFDFLRSNSVEAITSAHLVISGSSVILCKGEELVDVVRKGQGVLNLLPLAQVKEQVDGRIVDLSMGQNRPNLQDGTIPLQPSRRVG
ncbi:MAG: MerR family transcriptional regulator [Actinomycetota bacterium]